MTSWRIGASTLTLRRPTSFSAGRSCESVILRVECIEQYAYVPSADISLRDSFPIAVLHTSVYLNGTHSSWLGSGDAAESLVQAHIERANGFFLNAAN